MSLLFLPVLRNLVWLLLVGYSLGQIQAPSPFCPNPNGDFPNPSSDTCAAYFRCVQGRPLPMRCPTGQTFDFLLRKCSPRDVVDCDRQLQLYSTPVASNPNEFVGYPGFNGISSLLPSSPGAGQTPDQQNPFAFLTSTAFSQFLTPGGAQNAQQTPQGQSPFNQQVPLTGLTGLNQQQNPLGQGGLNQQSFIAGLGGQQQQQQQQQNQAGQGFGALGGQTRADVLADVLGQGQGQGVKVGQNGQLMSNGKKIGRMYNTEHGTVIVIAKQQSASRPQANIPSFQTVNTVPANQQGFNQQQAPPTGNHATNLIFPTAPPPQFNPANQRSPFDQSIQSNQVQGKAGVPIS